MAYADPPTVVTGDVAPASLWNTYVRGNFQTLDRGIAGVHSIGTGGGFGERYYPTVPVRQFINSATFASASLSVFYCVPLVVPRFSTLDRIAYEVTTLAGSGVARQGIYQATSETNPYPNALIVDGGELSTATTGFKTSTINVSLDPDTLYWAVIVFGTAAPVVRAWAAGDVVWSPIGQDTTNLTQLQCMFSRAQTYGALPATFPASPPAAYFDSAIRMVMRYSA